MSTTEEQKLPQMEYVRFGNTGMRVSRFALGCMSYGSSKWQPWVKDEEESLELIGKAYDAGINFFDTADVYSNGESERVLGKAIKKFNMPRSRIVVATKVFFTVADQVENNLMGRQLDDEPEYVNSFGLSRKHIFDACDASLERLGLDYIDLYQIHRFDHQTPIEETMEALNDLVRSGKVRYIGCSSCYAWEFQKANRIAEKNGWAKFSSMQNLYNLIYREEEREMIPYCEDSGIASIHWSPLARGLLTGKNRNTTRMDSDRAINLFFAKKESANNEEIIDRVVEVAEKLACSPAQVSLAWMLSKPHCTSPIVGVGKLENLYDVIGSLAVKLSEQDIKYLEEPYIPRNLIYMSK
ncbi:NADP-dependent oxidoreductase domain-containing protein [Mucor lusitanicus]|uniref:NADP-dependent oxidoreductase domain-containing protein n=1 Tax=Mucor circinelloides f. lusitanicus TaxID=29924 RepID=A0A8H4BI65_MUCCL|nr:NADP-dependent oxidoreductase domain-containing protein [Mucor lusitanicus]